MKGIKKNLNTNRYKYHLITVVPSTASGAAFCVRDNRVDIVRINTALGLKVFNKRYANRIVEYQKLIELDISPFFGSQLAKELRPLSRILQTFETSDIFYFLSNCPKSPENMRSYRGLQAIGRVLGISNKSSSWKHLISRVEMNKEKINGNIPFPGVEIDGS